MATTRVAGNQKGDAKSGKSNWDSNKEGNGDGCKSNGNGNKEGKGGKSNGNGNKEGNATAIRVIATVTKMGE